MILSSATHQVLSYLAHDKQLPAQLPKPCRPQKRGDGPLCAHTYDYLNDKGEAGDTLLGVGDLKEQIRNASHFGVDGINRNTRFSASHWMRKNSHAWQIVFSKREKKYEQACINLFEEEAKEARLKHRLNDLGRDYGLQIDNTGSHTVLKHLNDVEMKVLQHIVERDAPECVESVKKFRDGTKFNYRVLKGVPSYYRSTTPEPVTESQLEGKMLHVDYFIPGIDLNSPTMRVTMQPLNRQPFGRLPPPYTGEGEGETLRRYVE